MSLRISRVTKVYEGQDRSERPALKDVHFEAGKGSFVTLLGPSGCGKSTLLNILAGLDRPNAGSIEIDGRVVFDAERKVNLPPAERNISMVFQSYAIWPHMTVRENIEFPLRHGNKKHQMTGEQRRAAVNHALERVRLLELADRMAPLLSGGQQQRVALARALAQRPSIILLDEPLSNLDAGLREHMQKEIRSIVSAEGITAVYVTHDQKEALSMSDLIVMLKDGVVQQVGAPADIYYRPANRFVAGFMGSPNLLEATVIGMDESQDLVITEGVLGTVRVKRIHPASQLAPGTRVSLVLKQEDLRIIGPEGRLPADNCFMLPLAQQVFLGDRLEVVCALEDRSLSIYTNARHPVRGPRVHFACAPDQIHYVLAD